ncbi:MAG TPA: hypothetical protein VM054_09625 [bacterium]|nr:hypothetical protein [bacterium]
MVLRRALAASLKDILSRHNEAVLEGVSRSFPWINTRRRPLYILIGRNDLVYATALPAEGKSDLIRKFKKEPVSLSIAYWTPTDGPEAGYIYEACQVDAKGQDELLSNFWSYLRENLVGRGGIRYTRLPLYLAEYAWKFNHRKLSRDRKLNRLLNLLRS